MSTLSGRPFSSLLLEQGDHRGATRLPREGSAGPGQSGPGDGQGTATSWARTAARRRARAGPDAQLRAARTHRACAQTPQLRREASCAGSFFFPKCRQIPRRHGLPFRQLRSHWQVPRQGWPAQEGGGRRPSLGEEAAAVAGGGSAQPQDCEDEEDAPRPGREETGTQTGGDGRGVQAEPPEPWPALRADLKPLASPEAGMAEDDVPPEEKRLRLLLEGEAHSPRTARTGRTRRGQAGRRPGPRQVATAEDDVLFWGASQETRFLAGHGGSSQ
nr:uncharacterized protein LOC117978279 [Pan paniscus]